MCNCHSILECCVVFSGVKLSIRSFNLLLRRLQNTLGVTRRNEDMISLISKGKHIIYNSLN